VFACHGGVSPAIAFLVKVEFREQGSEVRLLLGREALPLENASFDMSNYHDEGQIRLMDQAFVQGEKIKCQISLLFMSSVDQLLRRGENKR
jgi:hypothetical protein